MTADNMPKKADMRIKVATRSQNHCVIAAKEALGGGGEGSGRYQRSAETKIPLIRWAITKGKKNRINLARYKRND
jgi:hypothetical protein